MCSTGEAGSSLSYVHMTYPDLLNFSMHEKSRTESIITHNVESINIVYACMRDSSTAPEQAPRRLSSGVSVGRRCFLCISSVGT